MRWPLHAEALTFWQEDNPDHSAYSADISWKVAHCIRSECDMKHDQAAHAAACNWAHDLMVIR